MSNFFDVQKEALEKGILLDSCGSAERQYSWGLYTDLCGMSVKDAKDAASACCCGGKGGDTVTITATFAMEKVGDEYVLFINTSEPAKEEAVATFEFEGEFESVIIPNGATKTNTYLAAEDGKQYAEISSIDIQGGEDYKYVVNNNVKTGFFNLTITITGTSETNSVKYGTEVTLPEVPEKRGYDFVWKNEAGEVISGTTIIMPEYDYKVIGNYVAQDEIICHYGMIYHSGVTTFSDFDALSSITCEEEIDTTTNFVIPANPEYKQAEEELDEEEFKAWCSAHTRDYFTLVPSELDFTFKNGVGTDITNLTHVIGAVSYKEKEYIARYYEGTTEIDEEQVFTMLINVKNKSN